MKSGIKLYLYSICEKQNTNTDSPVAFSQRTFQTEKRQLLILVQYKILTDEDLRKVRDDWFSKRILKYFIAMNLCDYAKLTLFKTLAYSRECQREAHQI